MIGKITPLVKVAGRRVWWQAVVGHFAGSTLSGALLGLVLGTLGLAIGLGQWVNPTQILAGGAFLLCALRDAGVGPWPLPSLLRQTPSWCQCALGPAWGGFAWGFDLGQGWTTRILLTGYYGLVLWTVLHASPIQGLIVLGTYGLGRAVPVLAAGLLVQRVDEIRLAVIHCEYLPLIQRLNATALAIIAGILIIGV